MNRLTILTIIVNLSASSVSAACTPSSLFDPEFSVSSLRFPASVEAIASGNPIGLELDPKFDVEDVRLRSVTARSDADIRAEFLVEQRGADSYMLTPRFHVGSGLTLAELDDLEFELEARVSYTRDGERYDETICLDELDASIAGGIDGVNEFAADFQRTLADLENADSVFDLIDAVIGAVRVMNDLRCSEAETSYSTLESSFEDHCTAWAGEIKAVVDGEATVVDACAALGDETLIAQCQANLSGPATNCPNLYAKMLEAEKNVSDVCYRNACAPVLDVESHASEYLDPLGRTTCDGTDITDPACQVEFERVQGPRCPGANVTALAKAEEPSAIASLASLTNICAEADPRDDLTILKDPTSDLVSSTSCMCLPALQGHIGQLERLYEYGRECLGGDENSTRECKNASFAFWCDMAVGTALQCGGLGYQEFSASTNVFADANGDPLDFESPDTVATAIEEGGYVQSGSGTLSVDNDRLGRAICSSALGDENVDWASVLSFDASASDGTNTLCREGVELTEPCVCDLSAVSGESLDICGTSIANNKCVYNIPARTASCDAAGTADPEASEPVGLGVTPSLGGDPIDLAVNPSVTIDPLDRNELKRAITSWPSGFYGSHNGITVQRCKEYPDEGFTGIVGSSRGTLATLYVRDDVATTHTVPTPPGETQTLSEFGPGTRLVRLYSCDDDTLNIRYESIDASYPDGS